MKSFLLAIAFPCLIAVGGCSRSDAPSAKATPTPNPNLKRDAERLQQATANVAREREKAAQAAATPSASP